MTGLRNPESAVFDAERKVIYVSNVDGGGTDKDGKGFISRLGPDGKVLSLEWVKGLNAPKGLALAAGKLFVADIDILVEIDLAAGKVSKSYTAEDAEFLNDVTVDEDGNVYVSDMLATRIYRLSKGKFSLWLGSEKLEYPNGLHYEGGKLIVGSWGKPNADFTTDRPGHMKVVDIKTREISPLGGATQPTGNLDGVEPDGEGGYFVTDWMAGKLFHIAPKGTVRELDVDLPSGAADLESILDRNSLVIPMMKTDRVVCFRFTRN
ncbi:MAG: SMP-30/gluconolactonase/LRE family protein [Verrucomicrobiota bacterium]